MLTTYAGFLISDYVYTGLNFLGHNMSMVGSLIYARVVYVQHHGAPAAASAARAEAKAAEDTSSDASSRV